MWNNEFIHCRRLNIFQSYSYHSIIMYVFFFYISYFAFQTLPSYIAFSVTGDTTSFADMTGFANAQGDWQRYDMEHSNTDPFSGILPNNLPVFRKIHRTVLKRASFEQACGFKLVCQLIFRQLSVTAPLRVDVEYETDQEWNIYTKSCITKGTWRGRSPK